MKKIFGIPKGTKIPPVVIHGLEKIAYVASERLRKNKNINSLGNELRKELVDSSLDASINLLQSAMNLRYNSSFRSGFLREGKIFSRSKDMFFVENNKTVSNSSKNLMIHSTTSVPNYRPPYFIKVFEHGQRLKGTFRKIARGPYHKIMKHSLLDTDSDYGNSKSGFPVRRSELELKSGFNEKSFNFLSHETYLSYEQILSMLTSINHHYNPNKCSSYWKLLTEDRKSNKNLMAGITKLSTCLKFKSRNPSHVTFLKIHMMKLKNEQYDLNDLIRILFDDNKKLRESQRIILRNKMRIMDSLIPPRNGRNIAVAECENLDLADNELNSENAHKLIDSISEKDIYRLPAGLRTKRSNLKKKLEREKGRNGKSYGTIKSVLSDGKLEKITNEEYDGSQTLTMANIEEIMKSNTFSYEQKEEYLNMSTWLQENVKCPRSELIERWNKHIKKLDEAGKNLENEKIDMTERGSVIPFHVNPVIQLNDYEAFNNNAEIVQTWNLRLLPNQAMKFIVHQNLSNGVCVNDLLYHLSNKNPKTNFGYYFIIEQVGEAGATIRSVRDKSYYEGFCNTRVDLGINFSLNYLSNVKDTMGYHEDSEGDVFQDEIEMYWHTLDNDATESNQTLKEIFYPKREKNKFHVPYSAISYNTKCDDLSKYILETSERILDDPDEKQNNTDMNNILARVLENQLNKKKDDDDDDIMRNAEPTPPKGDDDYDDHDYDTTNNDDDDIDYLDDD